MRITPETWKQVDPLLTAALALAEDERPAWLAELRERDPAMAPVLQALLATHERLARTGVDTVPRLAPVSSPASGFTPGAAVGPFRLVRLLGRGGMGEVWLADQADGRVHRQVALKLPTTLEARALRAGRFARERDILAKLEHPHIARLYDAGVAEDGQPWLAMEYVAGERLDAWVKRAAPPLQARLALFRQVLSAVAHAHRHLVVHRDIKPANILVDASGAAKLLDFGIAKLLGETLEDAQDLTRLGGRVMTLRYAAPEQVSGEAVTTVTDVYSLGVVLYELLAGTSPYAAARAGRTMNEATWLQEEVAVPSAVTRERAVARALSGDLDAILLKALRREPLQRYASIGEFDDDIRRYLEKLPVQARAGTWRYLAGRFAARHRFALGAGVAIAVLLVAGLVGIEHGRRVAVAERERAESHLASLRSLSNVLMFDVHDLLRDLPGATPARRKLAENAGRHLERIAPEAGDDPAFSRELADALIKLGNIQSAYGQPNLGQPDEALASYDRAVALLAPIVEAVPEAADLYVRALRQRGQLLDAHDRLDESIASFGAGLAAAQSLALSPKLSSPERRTMHAVMMVEHTWRLSRKSQDARVRERGLEEGLALVRGVERELPDGAPADTRIGTQEIIAWMTSQYGHVLRSRPDAADKRRAIGMFQEALAMREAIARRKPADVAGRRSIVAHLTFIGLTHADLGEARAALDHIARAAQAMEALAAADPVNLQFRRDAYFTRTHLADAQLRAASPAEALATAQQARAQESALTDAQRATNDFLYIAVRVRLVEGEAHLALAGTAPPGDRKVRTAAAREALQDMQRRFASMRAPLEAQFAREVEARAAKLVVELGAAR